MKQAELSSLKNSVVASSSRLTIFWPLLVADAKGKDFARFTDHHQEEAVTSGKLTILPFVGSLAGGKKAVWSKLLSLCAVKS